MSRALLAIVLILACTLQAKEEVLKVAVIGGMVSSGMWQEVAAAFEQTHGIKTEIAISGNKTQLERYVRTHRVDLITMHSSDTISDLVADGLFERLTPWARNAQMLVGVAANPAGILPADTLPQALQKIESSGTALIVHASGGSFEVYNALKERYNFHPKTVFVDKQNGFLEQVVHHQGYTLFGVIPFLQHKEHARGIVGFYRDDAALRRPYLAAVAPRRDAKRYEASLKLLEFLTSTKAQQIIQKIRLEGKIEYPLFFGVNTDYKE
ncbi:MAG: substrate-binding domain-containing protein [Campylobacterales bacterium]|nr:substrate-binding domain-containing protein [Campylobacterales bacterium]